MLPLQFFEKYVKRQTTGTLLKQTWKHSVQEKVSKEGNTWPKNTNSCWFRWVPAFYEEAKALRIQIFSLKSSGFKFHISELRTYNFCRFEKSWRLTKKTVTIEANDPQMG